MPFTLTPHTGPAQLISHWHLPSSTKLTSKRNGTVSAGFASAIFICLSRVAAGFFNNARLLPVRQVYAARIDGVPVAELELGTLKMAVLDN